MKGENEMNKRFFIGLVPLLAGLVFTNPANATFILDDPVVGNSWTLNIGYGGSSADLWRIDWVSGQLFELPTITSTTPGWSTAWATTTSGAISGPVTTPIVAIFHFADSPTDPFELNVAIYNASVLQIAARFFDTGTGSVQLDLLQDWDPGTTSPVPEPTTLALMALGLFGMAYRLRRKPAH